MIILNLSPNELDLLRTLLAQYQELVRVESDDPALTRLFPIAYQDDPDAAAEFKQYTRPGLVETKTARAAVVAAKLPAGGDDATVDLADDDAERWLPVLTDLRLIVAERLGIRTDDDEVPTGSLGEVYHWLGQLQAYLIDAIEVLADGGGEGSDGGAAQ